MGFRKSKGELIYMSWEKLEVIEGKRGKRRRRKVINVTFPKGPFEEFINDLMRKHDAGEVTDLILCYRDEKKGNRGVGFYWFGEESCTLCLGLTRRMAMEIEEYMKEGGGENG